MRYRRIVAPRPRRTQNLLFRGILLLVAVPALCEIIAASTGPKWVSAEMAYYRAQRLRKSLNRRSSRSVLAYLRVVRAYELVYSHDPQYRNAPLALASAAEVYREAGRHFANDRYYAKAIESYRFVISQYPHTRSSREALFSVADIYRRDVEDPEAARTAYREYMERYPRSPKAVNARLEIAHIDQELSDWNNNHLLRRPQSALADRGYGTGRMTEVESIRRWLARDYTRVVIQTGQDVKFNATHLENPPRLIFDLENTRLGPALAHKAFPVEGGFLRRIRVAQFKPKITRVVLDVPQIENYSVFSLPDPFRLVIDIRGQNSQQSAVLRQASAIDPDFGPRDALRPALSTSGLAVVGSDASSPTGAASESISGLRDRTSNEIPSNALPADTSTTVSAGALVAGAGIPPTLTRALGLKIRRIVIDPGHGGHDTGTLGPEGIQEKKVVLDVALRLRRLILRKLGCQVVMTRSTDTFVPLEERTAIANQEGADLFISIHANASRDSSARGIETYYLNFTTNAEALSVAARENATSEQSVFELQGLVRKIALSEKVDESRNFAKVVNRELTLHLNRDGDTQPDRGIKKAPFVVLIGANMPSILVEISFLTNPHDERLLENPRFRQQIAQALFDGIARYSEGLGTIRMAQRTVHGPPLERSNTDF